MKHPLIGLYSPVSQSGKSTVARAFAALFNGVVMSLAGPMREVVVPIVAPFFEGGEGEVWEWLGDWRKDHKPIPVLGVTLRHVLQTLGTEWGRQLIHPDVWTLIARERSRQHRRSYLTVIDDVRFENEYALVKSEGGILIRVNRPDGGERTGHVSEGRLNHLPFDYTIENDGTLTQLQAKVAKIGRDEFGEGAR